MAQFNFRLFLRPTFIGKIIIDRLTAENVDRQAEARRWIELGYMCEQAGFRLDGSTLFQAGRPVVVEASSTAPLAIHSLPTAAVFTPEVTLPTAQRSAQQPATLCSNAHASAPHLVYDEAPLLASPAAAEPAAEALPAAAPMADSRGSQDQLGSELLGNLRNLAH